MTPADVRRRKKSKFKFFKSSLQELLKSDSVISLTAISAFDTPFLSSDEFPQNNNSHKIIQPCQLMWDG